MFCSNCGTEVTEVGTFCPNCGSPLAQAQTSQPVAPVANFNPTQDQPYRPTQQIAQQAPQQPSPQQSANVTTPSKKKTPVIAIVIAAIVILAAIGFGASKFLGNGDSDSNPAPAPQTSDSESDVTDEADVLDSFGTPTALAFDQLTGAEIVELLEGEGWEWGEGDDGLCFTSPNGHSTFYVSGPDEHEYTYDEIRALPAFAVGEPACFVVTVSEDDYYLSQSAFSYLTASPVVVDDRENLGPFVFSVIHGPSMTESFAMIGPSIDDGIIIFSVFNPEGVEQGMVNDLLSDSFDGDLGYSVDEVWESINDRLSGA